MDREQEREQERELELEQERELEREQEMELEREREKELDFVTLKRRLSRLMRKMRKQRIRVSVAQIARDCGVSATMMHHVLNGKYGGMTAMRLEGWMEIHEEWPHHDEQALKAFINHCQQWLPGGRIAGSSTNKRRSR